MSQFSCPKCGYSLEEEGAILATCPRCEAALPTAQNQLLSRPFASMEGSDKLDVASLMRRVLAEQQPGEEIDAALDRILQREHPEKAANIALAIGQHWKIQHERFGQNRQQAAETLAKSQAFLSFDLAGKAFLETMLFQAQGLENLSPDIRQEIMEQIEKSVREGKPMPRQFVSRRLVNVQSSGKLTIILTIAVLAFLIIAYILSRH